MKTFPTHVILLLSQACTSALQERRIFWLLRGRKCNYDGKTPKSNGKNPDSCCEQAFIQQSVAGHQRRFQHAAADYHGGRNRLAAGRPQHHPLPKLYHRNRLKAAHQHGHNLHNQHDRTVRSICHWQKHGRPACMQRPIGFGRPCYPVYVFASDPHRHRRGGRGSGIGHQHHLFWCGRPVYRNDPWGNGPADLQCLYHPAYRH